MKPRRLLLLLLLPVLGCRDAHRDLPTVQFSSPRPRDTDVRITKELAFKPACVAIRERQTIEWWIEEGAPQVSVNVTSLGTPVELFSPSLVPPLFCDPDKPDTLCWRHSFERAGCFPYYDTNSGSPGRPVVDDYYGTVSYIGQSDDVQRGLVCVAGMDAQGRRVTCQGVCCNANFDCEPGFACQKGRCVSKTNQEPFPCPVFVPDAGMLPDAQVQDAALPDASFPVLDAPTVLVDAMTAG